MGDSVAVIGAGALGTLIAGWLHEGGQSVQLCARGQLPGVCLEIGGETRTHALDVAYRPEDATAADWVFVTTKAQDTASIRDWLGVLVGPATVVVVVQNGVDHLARLAGLVPAEQVLPAIAYISAERVGPGHVVHHIGERLVVPAGPDAIRLVALAEPTALLVQPDADFLTASWRKLLSNVAGNAITALTLRRMDVFADHGIRDLAEALLAEAVLAGRAEGAALGRTDIDGVMAMYAQLPPDNGSSMLYDRLAGRPLEHEYLTGAVVRAGDRHGVDVPLNRAVLALLRGLDASTARSFEPGDPTDRPG